MVSKCLFFLQLLALIWPTIWSFSSQEDLPIALPNCPDRCGDVRIPYPFGIGANCFHDASYEIFCNTSFHPPKPFLHNYSNLEVIDINLPAGILPLEEGQELTGGIPSTNICRSVQSVDFGGSPYRFSGSQNVLRVENCGHSVVMKNRSGEIVAGCASVCATNASNVNTTNCYGVGCCQASLPRSVTGDYADDWETKLDFYQIAVEDQTSLSSNTCNSGAAFIEEDSLKNVAGRMSNLSSFRVVLEWHATYLPAGQWNYDNFSCCGDIENPLCRCEFGYEGNPYLPYGCRAQANPTVSASREP